MTRARMFDNWPEQYDRWFTTPIGELVREYEKELIISLLKPEKGEKILDAGCGTGVFTDDILEHGALVFGIDISLPMLARAEEKLEGYPFFKAAGSVICLPFPENTFDKVVSITALEFIEDGRKALEELFRVTKRGGSILVATLNSLSSWAAQRREKAKKGQSALFKKVIFRSPDAINALAPFDGVIKTAIHFNKDDAPDHARKIELHGRNKELDTGAFLVAHWEKR
jgi:ubiquinone/menaquinone biosynthesis C-methylase UbiE